MRLMTRSLFLLIFSTFFITAAQAQDTLRIFQYNLFRYGETNKEPAVKNPLLKTIVDYAKPDIIGVNEISPVSDYANNILNGALNVNGETKWKKGKLSLAGNDKSLASTVFYNSNKFELIKQDTVSTFQREITAFNFFYKDSNLAITKDTIFFKVIVLHFKAGQTSANASARASEALEIKNYFNKSNKAENVFLMGDFNVYTSTEAAYQTLTANPNTLHRLYDPLNRPGNWNNNGTFADIHTQSTHSTQTGGFASGGMDDRFDILLCSKSVLEDSLRVRILPETYIPIGNDGQHFNLAINAAPVNTSVPADVLTALYNMSDHLPIRADIVFTPAIPPVVGIGKQQSDFNSMFSISNPFDQQIYIHAGAALKDKKLRFDLYDSNGKKVHSETMLISSGNITIDPGSVEAKGLYTLRITREDGLSTIKKLIKN